MVACVLVAPMHTRCMASTVNRRIVRMTEKEERELTRFTIWQEPWKVQGQKYRKLTADLASFLRSNDNDKDDTDNDNDNDNVNDNDNDNDDDNDNVNDNDDDNVNDNYNDNDNDNDDDDDDNDDDSKLYILRGGHHHY